MPLIGFIGDDGKNYPFAEALAAAERGSPAFASVPYPLLKGIIDRQQDRGDGISATSILHCLRSEYLTRREPYFATVESQYAMFRGTLFHGLLEANAPKNARVEERHRKTVNGIEISGQFDSLLLFEDSERKDGKRFVLQDWKTTKSLPKGYSSGAVPSPYSSHIEQLNVYRWLLDLPPDETAVEVWYFSMEGFVRTALKDGSGRSGVSQIWSDEKVEEFVTDRVIKLKASYIANTPMPFAMVPESDKWQCPYCPVRQRCADLGRDEAEAKWRHNAGLPPVGTPVDVAPEWQQIVDGVLARMEVPNADAAPAGRGKRTAPAARPRGGKR